MILRVIERGSWTLLAVCTGRGECSLLDDLEGLAPNLSGDGVRLSRLLERVAEYGPPKNTDINQKIKGDIWEFTPGRIRVLYFFDQGKLIVCSHMFVKKTQKTPAREIQRAEEIRARYLADKAQGALEIEEDE
jgi:phage-related protein